MPSACDAYARTLYPVAWSALDHRFFTQAVEEHTPRPYFLWPAWALALMDSRHLRRRERWSLTTFLLGNAVSPLHIVLWYLLRGCLRDKDAATHVRSILSGWMRGELSGYTVWDMNESMKVRMPGPGAPPRRGVDQQPWAQAVALLDTYRPLGDMRHHAVARQLCTAVAYSGWTSDGGPPRPASLAGSASS
jgi:hypothetical protein